MRATVEAVLAKLAAPGMCNPDDDTACVDGVPSEEAIERDSRSAAQRNHDGLTAALRAVLASGKLGQHNGLPASIIVTTTLAELEAAAGRGLTGGGTVLPMSDVIRLGRHARHYLAIFDKSKAVVIPLNTIPSIAIRITNVSEAKSMASKQGLDPGGRGDCPAKARRRSRPIRALRLYANHRGAGRLLLQS